MNSLPRLLPLCLVAVSLSMVSCATPANRRALYFSTKPHGPWTDYERRRLAEATTGVVTTSKTTVTTGPATPLPKSGPAAPAAAPAPVMPAPAADPTPVAPVPTAAAPTADAAAAAAPTPDTSVAPAITPTQ